MLRRCLGFRVVDHLEDGFRGELAHGLERLAHGGECGILKGRGLDVIEADDGHVLRDAQAGLAEGPDGSDGGDVVEGEERGKWGPGAGLWLLVEQMLCGKISGLVRGQVTSELRDQARVDPEIAELGGISDSTPTRLGVGGEALAFDEGDLAVAERTEVPEGKFGCAPVVEDDVGDALGLAVAGDGDGGDGAAVWEEGVDGDDGLDRALEQEALAAVDHLWAVVVADEEVEVAGVEQRLFDTGEHEGCVAFADFGDEDADGLAAAIAKGAREEIGSVVEGVCRREDAILG